MQGRLYVQGGLQAEGIFRINAENGQEEFVREQLNRGIIPDNIDVHCLAGLIKVIFRTLLSEYVSFYVAQTLQKCCRSRIGSSENALLLEDLTHT
uniref:Rac GTPase activating protein 1 n=1 Tax=Solanum tuberosum TaxID=4113 RepID=M1AHD4_SOLTU